MYMGMLAVCLGTQNNEFGTILFCCSYPNQKQDGHVLTQTSEFRIFRNGFFCLQGLSFAKSLMPGSLRSS
jgi:hypothetical protein